MEPLTSLLVETTKGEALSIHLSSSYLYWKSGAHLYCFHIDELIGCNFQNCEFSLVAYKKFRFRFFKFTCQFGSKFTENLLHLLNPTPKHFLLIYNPSSGLGLSYSHLHNLLIPILTQTSYTYEIFETMPNGYPISIINKIGEIFTHIIILGGTGTLHSFLTAIYTINPSNFDKITIGILPSGTRNSLSIDLNGKNINDGIYNILKNKTLKGDIMLVKVDDDVVVATSSVIWGVFGQISYEAELLKKFGWLRFAMVGIKTIVMPWKHCSGSFMCEKNDRNFLYRTGEFAGICIGNNRGRDSRNNDIAFPLASVTSGHIDAMIIDPIHKLMAARMLFQMVNDGEHATNHSITNVKFKKGSIKSDSRSVINIDGEMCIGKNVEIEVLSNKITYYGKLDILIY
ncbi:hypothetical protein SteCoe_12102 [Stentor coeruleus]|uniref:DAGKc domain-containing protein n=1 Tax=Stentor coeruleus TaxID=5963 RepID=A0A1R2CBK4_9CILI|nr:hypothetical protein SteCoe_12102 [Stentor coeruleus]